MSRSSQLKDCANSLQNLEISETSSQAAVERKRPIKILWRAAQRGRIQRRHSAGLFWRRSGLVGRRARLVGRFVGRRRALGSRILSRVGQNHRLREVGCDVATKQVTAAGTRLSVVSLERSVGENLDGLVADGA